MTRRRRLSGERGSTLVEAAIVTPVLMVFVFGIFEFGFAFRDYLAVSAATRDGARAASVAGEDLDADYKLLGAIERAAASLPDSTIDRIVIYEASGPNDEPSSTCKAGTPVSGSCNVYTAADFTRPLAEFGCASSSIAPFAPDRFWCPSDREVSVGTGLDYVGVWMQVTHTYITGLFGTSIQFDDNLVLKVEPQES